MQSTVSSMSNSPQFKPSRKSSVLDGVTLKVPATTSVNLDHALVKSPRSSSNDVMEERIEDLQLAGAPGDSDEELVAYTPELTVNSDDMSVMESEIDALLCEHINEDVKNISNYPINISDLIKRVDDIDDEALVVEQRDRVPGGAAQAGSEEEFFGRQKQMFVLSSSGKPIYSLFGSDSMILNYMGLIQTLISSFNDGKLNDNLKHFLTASTKFVVVNQSPVMLLAVSSLNESVYDLRNQLYIVYNYLIAVISRKQLVKVFELKENFDLRDKLLTKSDLQNLRQVLINKIYHPGYFLNAVESIYMLNSIKAKVNHVMNKCRGPEVFYGILTDINGKILTIIRPKNHFLHTMDLQVLFSVIFSQTKAPAKKDKITISRGDSTEDVEYLNDEELFFPICLPEFNSNGFLHCFVSYVDIHNVELKEKKPKKAKPTLEEIYDNKLVLLLLSADRNSFFALRKTAQNIISQLILTKPILENLHKYLDFNYRLNYLNLFGRSVTPFFHFIFKLKKNSQVFIPNFNSVNVSSVTLPFNQLMLYYKQLFNQVTLGNESLVFQKWTLGLSGLAYATSSYEIYILLKSKNVNKSQLIDRLKTIINWIFKNFNRLFIKGLVF